MLTSVTRRVAIALRCSAARYRDFPQRPLPFAFAESRYIKSSVLRKAGDNDLPVSLYCLPGSKKVEEVMGGKVGDVRISWRTI